MTSNNYDRYNNYAYGRQQQQQAQPTSYGSYSDTRSSNSYQNPTNVAQSSNFTSANVPRETYATQPSYSGATNRGDGQWYGAGSNMNSTTHDRNTSNAANAPRTDDRYAGYRLNQANNPSDSQQASSTAAQGTSRCGPSAHAPVHARGNSQHQQYGNYQPQAASANSASSAGSYQPPASSSRMQQGATAPYTAATQARSPVRNPQQSSHPYQAARSAAAGHSSNPGVAQQQQHHRDNTSHQNRQQTQGHHQQQHHQHERTSTPVSNESSAVTVDPTQVYDNSHELQRQAAKRRSEAEAVRRDEEARKKAEEEKKAEGVEAAKQNNQSARASAKPKQKKKQRTSGPTHRDTPDDAASAAAMTLMQTANEGGVANAANPGGADLEAQMKEMFAAMRKFNAANPEMLSRLWAQEREAHLASSQASQDPIAASAPASASAKKPKPKAAPKPRKSDPKGSEAVASKPQPTTQTPTASAPSTAASGPKPTTSQSTAPKAPGTIWPADKKASLADAVCRLIMQTPENQDKNLSRADISLVLDTNPSYDQLCTQLESRGLKIDKFKFARSLLSAVPGVSKPKASAAGPAPASNSSNAAAPADSAVNNLMTTASIVDTLSKKRRRPQNETPSTVNTTEAGPLASPPSGTMSGLEGLDAIKHFNERTSASASVGPAVSPAKQKPPRQRPSVKSLPATKEDQARKRTFNDLVDLTTLSDEEPPAKRINAGEQLPSPPQTVVADSDTSNKARQLDAPTTDKAPQQTNAPVQAPQQLAPVAQMQDSAAQQQKPKDLIPWGHVLRTIVVAEKLDRRHAMRRSTYNTKTIARDVLLACGRHPDMRHLNAHLDKLRVNLPHIRDDTDLSTIRWDAVDPGGLPPGSNAIEESADVEADFADDEDDTDSVLNDPHGGGAPTEALGPGSTAIATARSTAPPVPGRKIGRPRKSDTVFRQYTGAPSTGRPNQRPSGDTSSTGPSTYSALRAAQEQTGQTPSRGRPKGWRKWMQKSPGVASTGPSKQSGPKSGFKKPKSPSPEFPVFKCAWESCKAELHNLATLRRHLHKLHCAPGATLADPSGASYPCAWASCGTVRSTIQGPRTVSRFTRHSFPSATVWRGHVEAEHLKPIAWELGDGPAAGASDRGESAGELSEQYMSDREGRRVTPRVDLPDSAVDAAVRAREQGMDVMPPRQAKPGKRATAEEEARAEEWAAKERRRRLGGPGVDVAGGTGEVDGGGVVSRGAREGLDDRTERVDVVDDV